MKTLKEFIVNESECQLTQEEIEMFNEAAEDDKYAVVNDMAEIRFCNAKIGSKPALLMKDNLSKEEAMELSKHFTKQMSAYDKKYKLAHYKIVPMKKVKLTTEFIEKYA